MKFWLACSVLMFLGAEGLQWMAQVHWFNELDLSWPLIVLGGVGLAIASNRWPLMRSPIQSSPKPSSVPPAPTPTVTQPLPQASQPAVPVNASAVKSEPSISFEIRKPQQ